MNVGLNYIHNVPLAKSTENKSVYFASKNLNKLDSFSLREPLYHRIYTRGLFSQIRYEQPISVVRALEHLYKTKDTIIQENIISCHPKWCIKKYITALKMHPEISGKEVSALLGCGTFALAFETIDGKVLKLSINSHFPMDREPDFFDVPIYESFKLSNNTHYYLEKKLSQENISQQEMLSLCNLIRESGYEITDVWQFGKFLSRQFGKDENGKLYLLDSECAIKQDAPRLQKCIYNVVRFLELLFKE